jgi:Cu(I)/Ag(I) efflux system membrane fusion protein
VLFRSILYFACPMHPQYRSDKSGDCPSCGMRLEPVYNGDSGTQNPRDPMPPGSLHVSAERQQSIGLRIEAATRSATLHTIRVSGRITLDEARIFPITTAVEGLIRGTPAVVTGAMVRKDELLATFYNRDFLTAQQSYLYALNTVDRFKDNENAEQLKLTQAQLRAAEENLRFLGMGETQLQEIARTRQPAREIELRSPVAGLVLTRNAATGVRFDRGTALFQIADISRLWALADLFGEEARYVHPGQNARIILPDQRIALVATFSATLPQFDPASRALKARLELQNPGLILRPDMFVEVEFPVQMPAAITVPADAVVDSGLKKTVFIAKGDGYFEPRMVETGWRFGERVEVVKGLTAGEQIVVSGNFLLDSESRMRMTGQATGSEQRAAASVVDPVCGMEVDPARAARKSSYKGKTYYFCSDQCKREFDRDPVLALNKD